MAKLHSNSLILLVGASLLLSQTLAISSDSNQELGSRRKGKIFSLFSVVNFENVPCQSTSSLSTGSTAYRNGTCYTSSECADKGGSIKGSCAAGFGACCVFILKETSETTVSYNDTYIQNPNFPSVYDETSQLSYTVNKCSSDVCFLRLDFETFTLKGPVDSLEAENVGGACTDKMKVTVSSGQTIPDICGQNMGQHIYVAIGSEASATATIAFSFDGTSTVRTWEVKVSQIPCGSYAPPDGCLQWTTGLTGRLETFNFQDSGSSHLASQQYEMCIRQEAGYCCVQYTVCSDDNSFSLNRIQAIAAMIAATVDTNCSKDYITIAGSSGTCTNTNTEVRNRYCGARFSAYPTSTTDQTVCDCTAPFSVGVKTDTTNDAASATLSNRGNCLEYKQIPC